MNVDYINPFINASIEVIKTFAGINSLPGKPLIRSKPVTGGDIKGFIGLNGHGICGYFIIGFTRTFLCDTLTGLFNNNEVASDEELDDLAGELTNMITGSAKGELSKKGFFFDVAVPRITHTMPEIPQNLKNSPVIIVPFETKAGKFFIEASIKTIEEDLAKDTKPEVKPPKGFISVETFASRTRIDPIKIRRFLKTNFLSGEKISNRQWHIPESQLNKIQGYRPLASHKKPDTNDTKAKQTISVEKFSQLSNLSSSKIKSFLRTGFLKGRMDESKNWRINIDQVSKFK